MGALTPMIQTPANIVTTIPDSTAFVPAARSATRCVRLVSRYAGIRRQSDGQLGSDGLGDVSEWLGWSDIPAESLRRLGCSDVVSSPVSCII
jgi:hypothetical protein